MGCSAWSQSVVIELTSLVSWDCSAFNFIFLKQQLLEEVQAKQQVLSVPDVQSARLLLLRTSARATCQLRLVESFAESHDQGLWRCLCAILEFLWARVMWWSVATATLPLSLGLGLRSAERTKVSACCSSWADVCP